MAVEIQEKRERFRRYSDRRTAVLLALHQILFDHDPGPDRDRMILDVLRQDFEADHAALLGPLDPRPQALGVLAQCGAPEISLAPGPGLAALVALHLSVPGALTLSRVKRPSVFSPDDWESLWSVETGGQAQALLSVSLRPERAPAGLLWVEQDSCSREWSSRDRDLAEEVAVLLARAADKGR